MSGCGGGSQPISLSITASANTVDATDTITLSAVVLHDKNGAGVSWTVSGGGTISGSTSSATYTAPAASKSALTVTVTATSMADNTKTGTATITVPAAPAITTSSTTSGSVGTAYSLTLAANGGISPYTWTITNGTLPAGLTLSQAGVISGSPTAGGTGTASLTFKVSDSGKPTALTATANLSLTVSAAPAIAFTGTTLANATFNAAYTGAVAATGGAGTLTYAVASGALPTGVLMSTAGAISGIPTVAGTFPVSVKASDAFGDSAVQAFSLKVSYPAVAVTAATPPTGYVGSNYTQTMLAATGGSGSGYTWAVSSGSSLPAGLALSTAGVLTGKPTTAGTTTTSVTVTDSASNTGTASLSFTIKAGVSITTGATLLSGYVASAYSQTLAATGGSGAGYTWAVATGSTLPGGLALSSGGVISGKPTAAGSPSFSVTVTDSASNTATATFSMTIGASITISTPATLPPTFTGANYSLTLSATGGSGSGYSWAVMSGSTLPAGLTLSTAGVLSGKTTTAGTPTFSVTVTDSVSNTASATFSLTISAGVGITTPATLPTAYAGANYSQTLVAAGGTGTGYTWTVTAGASSLTAVNLSLSSSGVLSGKPAATGTATFSVSVTDSGANTASATFNLTVNAGVSITTTSPLATGYAGSAYSQTLAATGGSGSGYTWTVTSGASSLATANLTLSGGGVLSGTPGITGPVAFGVTVTDSASNTASATFSVTIGAGVTITTPITLPAGYQGAVYPGVALAATGGTGSGYTWTWAAASGSSLPAGLNLSAGGAITGTPTGSGSFSINITVKDSAQNSASATFSLNVVATLSITTTTNLPSGVVNSPYSQTLTAAGGSGANTWTVTSGASSLAAANLSLSGGGVLSGTPLASGSASFTAKVTDSNSHTATANFSVTINASLAIATTNLPAATTAALYSQTLTATGGTGTGYTWSILANPPSNLATFNLNLSAAGLISGTSATTGVANFTAQVTDSGGGTATAPLSITVYHPLALPPPNPTSLPSTGTTGVSYSGSINASGGSGTYCWTVTGLPSDGLSSPLPNAPCGYISGSLPISGTPTAAATITFTASVKDTTTGTSVGPFTYTITVTNPLPVTLPTPNPTSLPSATVNQSYTGSINASGGVSPFTWSINGSAVPTNGTPLVLTNGLSATNTGGNTLAIGGTPTATGTVTLTTVMATDSLGSHASNTYTVVVNSAGWQVSGQIFLNSGCGGSNTVPPITVSISTTPVQTTTTDNNGNYSFATVPNGTYTITPSITGASSVFYPATLTNVVVSNNQVSGENFSVALGYSVKGTVSYSGAKTGQVYLNLNNNNCGGGGGEGTSIPSSALSSGGAFTINGVPPGSYTLQSYIDNLGNGAPNATNPAGSVSVTVSNANITGASVTLVDPTVAAPTKAPAIQTIEPTNLGVVISYKPITNSNGVESVTSYNVEWSTSSSFTSTSSITLQAKGNKANVWFLNNSTAGITGTFSNGTAYYFRVQASVAAGAGPWGVFGSPTAITIGTPSGAGYFTVSGTAIIPSDITPTGPLYVGFFDQNTGTAFATRIVAPTNSPTGNPYTVSVPSGSNYFFFGILDQNNDGQIDAGDVSNTDKNNNSVTISGNLTGEDETLPDVNSTATAQTQYNQNLYWNGTSSNTSISYNINFDVRGANKLPVAVQLVSASNPNVIIPVDISNLCQGCGSTQFNIYENLATDVPVVNDTYTFNVTYSDGSTGVITGKVTSVLGASALAINLEPQQTDSTSITPTFTWTYPSSATSYTYQFYLCCDLNNNIWSIPGNNSNTNGFTNSQIPASLTWGVDPTNSQNIPTVSSLTSGTSYNWSIQTQDSNGNSAQTSVWYQP